MIKKTRYLELSHPIIDGMETYKGLPKPLICDYFSREVSEKQYSDGSSFQIGKVEMMGNTGTYMDCPFHRYAAGEDFNQIQLEDLVNIPGVLIPVPYREHPKIRLIDVENVDVRGKAVLFCTGWSAHWGRESYFSGHPYLSTEVANYLVKQCARIVGIDAYNVDNTATTARPVHSTLLVNCILIIEHMTNLDSLIGEDFLFTATPPRIEGIGSFPVRAFATVFN